MDLKKYDLDREKELQVIQYINEVWSKGKWIIKQSTFRDDMKGIDATGFEINASKENTRLLIQIKSDSWLKIDDKQKREYLERITREMIKKDKGASRRLILWSHKYNKLWNYSIDKLLAKLKKEI